MSATPLREARDERALGGKAVQLGAALRAGLPVPSGFALATDLVDAIAAADARATELALGALDALGAPVAVRSSAIGEDSARASFAGVHKTVLHVRNAREAVAAIREVWASARTPAALAYRARLGLPAEPKIAVVIQTLVHAECAGVLFTRDPISGADQRVIESSWGFGEAIVSGLVTPDRHRVARDGTVLERACGLKDRELRLGPDGGIEEREVEPARAGVLCLGDARVHRLHDLATACEQAFGRDPLDLEWAFAGEALYLLQRRAITRRGGT